MIFFEFIKTSLVSLLVRRLLITSLLVVLSSCIALDYRYPTTSKSKKIYPPEQLRADLYFLDKALKEIHPEPFSRIQLEIYKNSYDQLYLDLSYPQRRSDFYRQLTPLVTSLADTHTRILYPQQEYQQFIEQDGRFPLVVLYSSEELIVLDDIQKKPVVPVGAVLVSINDISVQAIRERFKKFVPSETESGERRMIQMEFHNLLRSVYQFANIYQVEYIWQNKLQQKKLYGVKYGHLQQATSTVSYYGAISIDQNTSLLWLNDFNEEYDKFEEFLDQQFQEMKDQNKTSLILDLRYNEGGITDNLSLLLSYLSNTPINWATQATLKLSKQFRRQHSSQLDKAKNQKYGSYLDWLPVEYLNVWQWDIFFADNGDLLKTEIGEVVSEKENYFQGKIIVLSNGYCFSACASLIATLQENGLAKVVGESPGSLTNVQYGYPVQVKLPNTGLKVVIPAMKFVRGNQGDETSYTVIPDYLIERRRTDVLLGLDPVFDFALELSKSQ